MFTMTAMGDKKAMPCGICEMFIVVSADDFMDDFKCIKCKHIQELDRKIILLEERILTLKEIAKGEQAVDCFNNISVMRLDPHPASCSSPHNTSGRWTTQRRKTGRQPLLLPPEIITRNRYSVLSDYEEHENLINSDCPCSDSDEILLIGDSII